MAFFSERCINLVLFPEYLGECSFQRKEMNLA